MIKYLLIILSILLWSCNESTPIPGCTDISACNYNVDATEDNNTCVYVEGTCDCNAIQLMSIVTVRAI